MIVDIIGPGAIGLHLALALPPPAQVRLRHPRWQARSEQRVQDDQGRSRRVQCLPLSDPTPVTAAVFTTKSGQVIPALCELKMALSASAELLLLHNGLGPQAAAARELSDHPKICLLAGVTSEGAVRDPDNPWQIRHTGRGPTWVGPWKDDREPGPLGHCLMASGLNAGWLASARDVRQHIWEKLIVNCAINPLTALYDIPNGSLQAANYVDRWQTIVAEATRVAQAEGLPLSIDTMQQRVQSVLAGTASNFSSMHQDIIHHRGTEAPWILGAVIDHAKNHRLPVPELQAVHDAIAKIDRQ